MASTGVISVQTHRETVRNIWGNLLWLLTTLHTSISWPIAPTDASSSNFFHSTPSFFPPLNPNTSPYLALALLLSFFVDCVLLAATSSLSSEGKKLAAGVSRCRVLTMFVLGRIPQPASASLPVQILLALNAHFIQSLLSFPPGSFVLTTEP